MPQDADRGAALLRTANRGSAAARADVLRSALDQVERIVRWYARSGSARIATEDLVQDCAVSILRHAGSWEEDPRRFRAWLRALARNAVRQSLRDQALRTFRREETLVEELAGAAGTDLGEELDELRRRFARLPADERVALLLRDFLELSWSTVAALLGRSIPGARQLRGRALRRMRRGRRRDRAREPFRATAEVREARPVRS